MVELNKQLLRDSFGWGFVLWFIGYVLGILLFFVLPPSLIGWVIMPVGIIITLWVLMNQIKNDAFQDYIVLAIVWTAIAIAFDYLFIVKALNPADGYYKLDVYLYYALTFSIPLIVGWWRAEFNEEMAE